MCLTGCASIQDGTEQTIVVNLKPREARCSVMRNDVELGTITGSSPTITMSKGARDVLFNCSAPGHEPKTARLVSSTQANGMVSFFLLDLGITDMITGAMWKYPSNTNIILEPIGGDAAAAPVQTGGRAKAEPLAIGQFTPGAETVARNSQCSQQPRAGLVAKGPGFETYSVACSNGDAMMVRCEMGNCRAMR